MSYTKEITKDIARDLLPARIKEGHKYSFGSVLVIGGSKDKPGAAALTCEAVLAAGAGAVTLAAPDDVFEAGVLLPEVMRLPLKEVLNTDTLSKFDVFAVGPGLGDTAETRKLFDHLLAALLELEKPVVIDADGLNILSRKPRKLNDLVILTPHIGEARRLLGAQTNTELRKGPSFAQLREMVLGIREKYAATVVLKSDKTLIFGSDGKIWQNTTGDSGLATAGSGDVLTGVIAGLLAQGCDTLAAAQLGVYMHGLAGEMASDTHTEYGVRAGLVSDFLAPAMKSLID